MGAAGGTCFGLPPPPPHTHIALASRSVTPPALLPSPLLFMCLYLSWSCSRSHRRLLSRPRSRFALAHAAGPSRPCSDLSSGSGTSSHRAFSLTRARAHTHTHAHAHKQTPARCWPIASLRSRVCVSAPGCVCVCVSARRARGSVGGGRWPAGTHTTPRPVIMCEYAHAMVHLPAYQHSLTRWSCASTPTPWCTYPRPHPRPHPRPFPHISTR